jgi:hypothetical protein
VPKLSRRLRRSSVGPKQPTQPLLALDCPHVLIVINPLDHELVAEAPVVSLEVIVLDVFADDPPQMAFAEWAHLGHAF